MVKNNLHITLALLILFVTFLSYNGQIYTGEAVKSCSDSDNGDYYVKGITKVDQETLQDYCDGDVLIEYYCDNKEIEVRVYPCGNACEDGACLEEEKVVKPTKQSLQLASVNDQIEIGEYIGDVREAITEEDTDALRGGVVSTRSGSTEFSQYLRFKATDFKDGRVLFAEDEDDVVGDFLVFEDSKYAFEYELQFGDGFPSKISGSNLPDLENEEVFILDREFSVLDATLNSNRVKLQLVSGELPSRIEEGETKRYQLENGILEVEVLSIDDTNREAALRVNDKRTARLEEGEIATIDGIIIGIDDILISEAGEGSDFLTFYLGAERITFEDDDYTDNDFTQGIRINGETISDGFVKIKATKRGDDLEILSIKYRMKPDGKSGNKVYIPPGKGLKDMLKDPQTMLANWDIVYEGLSSEGTKVPAKIDPRGGDEYNLEFQNIKGDAYNIPFLVNVGGNLKLGDDGDLLHFIEGTSTTDFIVETNDYVILTNKNGRNGVTSIIRYSSIDTSSKTVQFDELAEGSKTITYSGTEGTDAVGDLVVAGNTYAVYIGPSPDYKLAMDLTSDGDVSSDEANIVIQGGGLLDLGSTSNPNTDFSITLTTEASQFDSSSSDETITINMLASGSDVDLDLPAQASLTIETASGKNLGLSDYGIMFEQEKDNPDELTINYPTSQAVADIQLAFFQTPTSTIEIIPEPVVVKEPEPEVVEEEPIPEPIVVQKPTPEPPKITYVEKKPLWKRVITNIVSWFI